MESSGSLINGSGQRQQSLLSQTSRRQSQRGGTTARAEHQALQALPLQAQQQTDRCSKIVGGVTQT